MSDQNSPQNLSSNSLTMLEAHCNSIGYQSDENGIPLGSVHPHMPLSPSPPTAIPEGNPQSSQSFYRFLPAQYEHLPPHLPPTHQAHPAHQVSSIGPTHELTPTPPALPQYNQRTNEVHPGYPYENLQSRYRPLMEPSWMTNFMTPFTNYNQDLPNQLNHSNYLFAAEVAKQYEQNPLTPVASKPTVSASRRYAGTRGNCDCPDCQQIDRIASSNPEMAAEMRKNSTTHSCHVPGCGKVYTKTSHLKAHLRWHTGERPFVCNWQLCGRRFLRSDELQKHLKTHENDTDNECPVCQKKFQRCDYLTRHMSTHSVEEIQKKMEGADSKVKLEETEAEEKSAEERNAQ
ncbi:unnamed protein product [Rodentolepis nana]|uniref:C2H2-type domain-containing protein n=1 Tax=Rodentolepis nana TaxID=102285 RepID=A0A0R3TWD6_RODNA|nr:unnamed protein product [Rodentolepis nana]